jgi:hypothetical protein
MYVDKALVGIHITAPIESFFYPLKTQNAGQYPVACGITFTQFGCVDFTGRFSPDQYAIYRTFIPEFFDYPVLAPGCTFTVLFFTGTIPGGRYGIFRYQLVPLAQG